MYLTLILVVYNSIVFKFREEPIVYHEDLFFDLGLYQVYKDISMIVILFSVSIILVSIQ